MDEQEIKYLLIESNGMELDVRVTFHSKSASAGEARNS
jgi:hypothetical protein